MSPRRGRSGGIPLGCIADRTGGGISQPGQDPDGVGNPDRTRTESAIQGRTRMDPINPDRTRTESVNPDRTRTASATRTGPGRKPPTQTGRRRNAVPIDADDRSFYSRSQMLTANGRGLGKVQASVSATLRSKHPRELRLVFARRADGHPVARDVEGPLLHGAEIVGHVAGFDRHADLIAAD